MKQPAYEKNVRRKNMTKFSMMILAMFSLVVVFCACGGEEADGSNNGDGGDESSDDSGGSDNGSDNGTDTGQPVENPIITAGYDCESTDTTLCDSTACAYVPKYESYATQDCTDRRAYCDAVMACVTTYVQCLTTGCPPGQALGPETGPASMDCGAANTTCISDAGALLQTPK
jgi:hypothetical protein